MNKSSEKEAQQFLGDIAKLEAVEFIGLTKLLGVELLEGEGESEKLRPMGDILDNVMIKFLKLNRNKRRELKKIVRAAGRIIKK